MYNYIYEMLGMVGLFDEFTGGADATLLEVEVDFEEGSITSVGIGWGGAVSEDTAHEHAGN